MWVPSTLQRVPLLRRAAPFVRRALGAVADPRGTLAYLRGLEDFDFSGSRRLPDVFHPDLIHCHNLHGNYFDLTALPALSERQPVVLTMHDCWLLSGHCAQPLDCERWRTGCGECPYLFTSPPVGADATAFNWLRKAEVFRRSRLFVAVPAQWLIPRVQASMFFPAVSETRIIPHGIDLTLFRPGNRREARQRLGLPLDGHLLLTSAAGGRENAYKDVPTLERALLHVAPEQTLTVVIAGETGPSSQRGLVEIRRLPFEEDVNRMADLYRAADVYVHASRAEVLPLSIIEALACGTPVIASTVGGVAEIVRPIGEHDGTLDARGATGMLVAPGDEVSLAQAITQLLSDSALRNILGANARRDAEERFDVTVQTRQYVEWYEEILARHSMAT